MPESKQKLKNSTGYVSEVFSSIQGEGGTVRGSCFGTRQIFIRLAGCNLANGAFNSAGCFWCDSREAQNSKPNYLKYEDAPGSQMLKNSENPAKPQELIKIINDLITPDLHSISFTGGEPLLQQERLIKLLNTFSDEDHFNKKPFVEIETNGLSNL